MLDARDALAALCGIEAPAGFESAVTAKAAKLLEPLVDSCETDKLGNLLGRWACGEENAKTVLLDAHLDEIGFMVTGKEDGYLRFCAIGGVDERMLPAGEVTLLTEPPTYGVVACLPPHVLSPEDREKAPRITELYIDAGGAEVPVGTVGTYRAKCFPLGEKMICAKSLDDRACFVAILRALELIPAVELLRGKKRSVNIVVCGSVQEELGTRGIGPAAYSVNPDYGVAVDVTYGRSPDTPREKTFELGSGPCVGMGPECDRRLSKRLAELAKERKIPYNLEIMPGRTGTNGGKLQTSRGGVVTAVLSFPVKYMHSPVEVMHLDDLENTARLLAEWVVSL